MISKDFKRSPLVVDCEDLNWWKPFTKQIQLLANTHELNLAYRDDFYRCLNLLEQKGKLN